MAIITIPACETEVSAPDLMAMLAESLRALLPAMPEPTNPCPCGDYVEPIGQYICLGHLAENARAVLAEYDTLAADTAAARRDADRTDAEEAR